jgi:hypothetical protein
VITSLIESVSINMFLIKALPCFLLFLTAFRLSIDFPVLGRAKHSGV